MARVVILNSPPRGGKDHAAKFLTKQVNDSDDTLTAVHREMKTALFEVAARTLGITVEEFLHRYDETSELSKTGWFKDYPLYPIGFKIISKRDTLIHMSENVIKPMFGKSAFGMIEANKIGGEDYIFYSDGGFADEVIPLINKVGADNVLIIRIEKEGCTFEGDSRSYLSPSMFSDFETPHFVDIVNVHGEVDQFENDLLDAITQWEIHSARP